MAEQGIAVSHPTITRWVPRSVPEYVRRWARHARRVDCSWRMDETAVLVRGGKFSPCRAVDRRSKSVASLLCENRDTTAAQAFLRGAVASAWRRKWPRTINVDRD